MKTEFLKELGLTEEQIKSVMAENGKDVQSEKDKTTNTTTELEGSKAQLVEANKTITNLKKNNSDNDELQTKVKEYEDTMKTQKSEYESKIKNLTLDTAINSLLTTNKAKHSDLLASKFDREKLVINADGTVTGLEEQFKGIKDTYKDLFEQTLGGNPPENPEDGSGGATGVTKEQFTKMGYKEKVNLYNTNKELYDQLKGQE